jgi:hypothetical protein
MRKESSPGGAREPIPHATAPNPARLGSQPGAFAVIEYAGISG